MEGGEMVCELADESALQVWQNELASFAKLNLRPEIGLNPEFFPLVLNGSKTTTVRYSKGCIHFPQHTTLPLIISTTRDGKGDVVITKVVIKRFRNLNDEDAKKDGFRDAPELVDVLQRIYGEIDGDEHISIYHFDFVPKKGT